MRIFKCLLIWAITTFTSPSCYAMELSNVTINLDANQLQQEISKVVEKILLAKENPKTCNDFIDAIEDLHDTYGQKKSIEILQMSLSKTNTSLCDIKDFSGRSVLNCSCTYDIEILNIFLAAAHAECQKLLFQVSKTGNTALHSACLIGEAKHLSALLASAGDQAWNLIIKQNFEGNVALHEAVKSKCTTDVKMVTILLSFAPDKQAARDLIKLKNHKSVTAWSMTNILEIEQVLNEYLHEGDISQMQSWEHIPYNF